MASGAPTREAGRGVAGGEAGATHGTRWRNSANLVTHIIVCVSRWHIIFSWWIGLVRGSRYINRLQGDCVINIIMEKLCVCNIKIKRLLNITLYKFT